MPFLNIHSLLSTHISSLLHLNHYVVQSFRWFMTVKSTRGAADAERHENSRTKQYFQHYDQAFNDVDDRELSVLNSQDGLDG